MAIRVHQLPQLPHRTEIPKSQHPRDNQGPSAPFGIMLEKEMTAPSAKVLKFSAHACQRLEQRQIELGTEDLLKLDQALDALDKKGGRNAVLFFKDTAFVASVSNRTVITAIPMHEDINILTQIDSAATIR